RRRTPRARTSWSTSTRSSCRGCAGTAPAPWRSGRTSSSPRPMSAASPPPPESGPPRRREMSRIKELGYVVYEVGSLANWEHFGVDLLGMQLGERTGDGFTLRTDEKAYRWVITEGPADDLVATGYEVSDAAALDELVE